MDFSELDGELEQMRATVRRFLARHAPSAAMEEWRKAGVIPRSFWSAAADAGLLGLSVDPDHGGLGADFRYEALLAYEIYLHGLDAFALPLHNAMVAPYLIDYATAEQKRRWLPGLVSGDLLTAIAMTEPGAGSDLQGITTTAIRQGDHYILNGQKTFISSGQTANLIVVVCKTDPGARAGGISLLVVETDRVEGFRRGRNLDKLGLEAADTSELFFDNVAVPAANLLGGREGQGFYQLMEKLPQERLLIAIQGLGVIDRALAETIAYTRDRTAFGKPIGDFQNTQFKLAECKTEATVAKAFVEHCIVRHLQGRLDAATASMAKYWVSEAQCRIVDECLQLHGGYGYMLEYPIARMYRDSRIQKIYGGTNEIMKLMIARAL